MNINELKAEANRLGFSIAKKITYEKVLPCPCGSKHWVRQEMTMRGKYYRCTECGYTSIVSKFKYEAIHNWNVAARDYNAWSKHNQERIQKLLMEKKS